MSNKKKTRIFIEAHCFDNEHQGIRAYIKRLYFALNKSSDDLEYYFAANDIENLKKEFGDLKNSRFLKYRTKNRFVRLVFEIPFLIKKNKIDLAHFQYISPFFKACKYIVTTHDVLFLDYTEDFSLLYRWSRKYLFKRSIEKADIRLTVSEYSLSRLVYHFNLPSKTIYITPNGIDNNFAFNTEKKTSQEYIKKNYNIQKFLLFVSRFEPRKNHFNVLKAFYEMRLWQKGYFLVLLGHKSIQTAAFTNYFKKLTKEATDKIFFSVKINDQELHHFYKACEVLIYPSKAEGFGLPPIEAGAIGVPVICSNTTAMKDFTFFEENHIDPNNYDLLKERIDKIINSPPSDDTLRTISKKIHDIYSYDHHIHVFKNAIGG